MGLCASSNGKKMHLMSLCPFSKRHSPSLKWEIALSQKRSRFNGTVPGSSEAQQPLFQYAQPAVAPPPHPFPTVSGFIGKVTRAFALTEERLIKALCLQCFESSTEGL